MKLNKQLIIFLLLTLISSSVLAESCMYVGGHFRRQREITVPTLKASGFTDVILFNIEVGVNGDLLTDGDTVCTGGKYVFDKVQPYYINDVNALKTGKTSINRIETCIGGWTSKSYNRIRTLVNSEGTGENSILYKNFKALKEAIPVIEAINNDDEDCYDASSAVKFHIMLYDIGYKTTTAPYTQKTFWQNFVTQINTSRPGAVDRIYLQCYDGGAGNVGNPDAWKVGDVPLYAGMMTGGANAAAINTQMNTWKNNSSVCGGFLWVYNSNYNLKPVADAINSVFGGGEVVNRDKLRPQVTLYSENNQKGASADFEIGKYSTYAISAQNFSIQSLASVKIQHGFKLILYKEENQKGESITIQEDVPDISQLDEGTFSSIEVITDNNGSFKGKDLCIRNRESDLYFTIAENRINVGIGIVQKEYQNDTYEQWTLKLADDGFFYTFINKRTGRSLQVTNGSMEEEAGFEQAVGNQELMEQKFIILPSENASFYKIMSLHSLKYLGIKTGKEEEVGAPIVQKSDKNDETTDWIFIDPKSLSGINETNFSSFYSVYPNPATDFLIIGNTSVSGCCVKINNLQGLEIACPQMEGNKMDISNLPKGIYFLSILPKGAKNPVVSKFIKM